MASTDALPVPQKNVAMRVTFPIYKSDGTLITGAAGLDSEVSKDGGTAADCTNEATEIATSTGTYYLDLTSTEMNADTVSIVVKTSSTGAVIPVIVMYPEEGGNIRVNVTQWLSTAASTPTVAGVPNVNVKTWNDLATVALPLIPTTAGRTLDVSSTGEAGVDWANVGSPTTSLALTGTTIAVTQKVDVETIKTNPVVNGGTVTFATNTTVANTTGAVGSVTGAVGSVTGLTASDVGAIKTQTDKFVFTVTNQVDANVKSNAGTAITAASGVQEVKVASVAANAITATAIASDAITAAKIADGAIDAATFAAGAIDNAAIAADAIGSSELAASAINEIADGILDRDMSSGADNGSTTVRTPRQALRGIRNKFTTAGGTLTVFKEDDSTTSWTSALSTDAAADPIVASDPAGP